MKLSELMIGDWVYVEKAGKPVRIESVGHTVFVGYEHFQEIDGSIYGIQPIELTEEILEKNGFEVSSEHARYYFEKDGEKYEFVLRKMYYTDNPKIQKGWSFYAFNVITLVEYVHELQHALKFCGVEKEIVV